MRVPRAVTGSDVPVHIGLRGQRIPTQARPLRDQCAGRRNRWNGDGAAGQVVVDMELLKSSHANGRPGQTVVGGEELFAAGQSGQRRDRFSQPVPEKANLLNAINASKEGIEPLNWL